jgi:hypothetical protein
MKPKGWRGQPARHALAAAGISTKKIAQVPAYLRSGVRRTNIMLQSEEEKFTLYDKIGLHPEKVPVLKEHSSGFPAVTLDYPGIHVITDILSLDKWKKIRSEGGK